MVSENPLLFLHSTFRRICQSLFKLHPRMGKKSEESHEDAAADVKSIFSLTNPYRRKPQQDAGDIPQPTKKQWPVLDAIKTAGIISEANAPGEEAAKVKKRKRDKVIKAATPSPPSSDEETAPTKREKLVGEVIGEESNWKKKKRKRGEVELEYEKRNRLIGVDEAAAVRVVAVGQKRKLADSTANIVETIKPFDDESKLLRTVFVGNLALNVKKKALNREFAKFGEIESVRIRSVPLVDTKAPRKAAIFTGQINKEIDSMNAYIVFKDEQSAQAALSLNMSQVCGNHIRVDMARPPVKKMKGDALVYDKKKTAFVGNLPFDVKDEELYQLFCGLCASEPNVEAVRVIRDPKTSAGKGIAYVLFKSRDDVNKVCKIKDLKIRDRHLRVCHVKSDATPSNKAKEAPTKSFSRQSPATGFRKTPSGKGEKRTREATTSASYEGTRSSKKGIVKKPPSHSFPTRKNGTSPKRSSPNDFKGRPKKRPAVVARKAEQLKKRKQAGTTPENSLPNKRARRQ